MAQVLVAGWNVRMKDQAGTGGAIYDLYAGGCYVSFVCGRVLYMVCTQDGSYIVWAWEGALYRSYTGRCYIRFVNGRVRYIVRTQEGVIYGL